MLITIRIFEKSLKILEIGTFDGLFTKYLSEIFSESEIITIDLPHNDTRFVQSYGREEKSDTFLVNRSKNIKNSNITFIEMDSLNILNKFSENFFDIIFVDGDHRDPVVSKDIFNSYKLLKNNGFLLVDDIYLNFTHREKIERMEKIVGELPSIDGYNALERLSKEGFLTYTKSDGTTDKMPLRNFFINNSTTLPVNGGGSNVGLSTRAMRVLKSDGSTFKFMVMPANSNGESLVFTYTKADGTTVTKDITMAA